jgi:Putative transmembrane protein (PGPGW)
MTNNDEGTLRGRARSLYRSLPRPLRRVSVLVLGSVILIAGVAMLVLPGPGLL